FQKLCREALACRRLHHPSVLEFLGIDNKTFKPPNVCLLSPFLKNGTVMAYRKVKGSRNIPIISWIVQIAEGLQYIHSESVIHGDLHPGNILVDDEELVKLTDFGLARLTNATTTDTSRDASGSLRYMAPELYGIRLGSEPAEMYKKTKEADIFAFASVCYALFRGYCPLHQYGPTKIIMFLSKTGNPWLTLPRPTDTATGVAIPDVLWQLVQRGWGISSERPTLPENLEKLRVL
ncbi:kinase-like domain-containing protein, partial [Mycena alexandri]